MARKAASTIAFLAFLLLFGSMELAWPQQSGEPATSATSSGGTGKKYVPGQILVRFRDGRTRVRRSMAHSTVSATVLGTFESMPEMELVRVPENVSVADAVNQYSSNSDVLYAEPDYLWYPTEQTPNDPSFAKLWGLKNVGSNNGLPGADIKATDAWELTTGSADVVVAVIDTGINYTHPELASRIFKAESDCKDAIDNDGNGFIDDCYGINTTGDGNGITNPMDYLGHGTHVAGTIGAAGNNSVGVVGVNWDVRVLPCKFLSWNGGSTSAALRCLDYVAKFKERGVNVVASNNSWGGGAYSWALKEAIRRQLDLGILFVTSAGNGGIDGSSDNNDELPVFPASYGLPNMITVAATDRSDRLATFSNFGRRTVHIAAPGVGILSTFGNDYGVMDGTSMASPHVAGVAALLKAYNPALQWYQIRNLILAGGDITAAAKNTISGRRLNAYKALTCSGENLLARTEPRNDVVTTTPGVPVQLEVVHVNCDQPAGDVVATVAPGGQAITLRDDGQGVDLFAADGIYTAEFLPSHGGTHTVTLPNGDSFTLEVLLPYAPPVKEPQPYRNITGTSLKLEDEEVRTIELPFPVRFGGATFNKIFVGDNGTISLNRGFTSAVVYPIPYPHLPVLIAPWWLDFAPLYLSSQNVYWEVQGTAPSREVIVEWRDVLRYAQLSGGGVTFQAVLFEDRDDVLFNYKDSIFGGSYNDNGWGATIGVQVSPVEGAAFPGWADTVPSGTSLLFKTASDGPDLAIGLHEPNVYALRGETVTFNGYVKGLYGYNSNVTVGCSGNLVQGCTPKTLRATRLGTEFSMALSASAYGSHTVTFQAEGNDPAALSRSVNGVLWVPGFRITPAVQSIQAQNGELTVVPLSIESLGGYRGTPILECTGLPIGAKCVLTKHTPPDTYAPVPVTLSLYLAPETPIGNFEVRVVGTGYVDPHPDQRAEKIVESATVRVEVQPNADFYLVPTGPALVSDNQTPATTTLKVAAQDGFSGTVRLGCTVEPVGPLCEINPPELPAGGTAVVRVTPASLSGSGYKVTITGTSGERTRSIQLGYLVFTIAVQPTSNTVLYTGNYNNFFVDVAVGANYKGKVKVECDLKAIRASQYCSVSPSTLDFATYSSARLYMSTQVAADVAFSVFPMIVRFTDLETGQASEVVVPVKTQGFTWTPKSPLEQTVIAGASVPFEFVVTPQNGYALKTRFELTSGWAFPREVTFSPPEFDGSAGPVTVKGTVTIPKGDAVAGGAWEFYFNGKLVDPLGVYPHMDFLSPKLKLHIQDFKLSLSSERVHIAPGSSARLTITNTEYEGLDVPVYLSCPAEMPTGVTCTFDKPALANGESTVVTLTAAPTAEKGYRQLGIVGTADVDGLQIQHSFPFVLETSHITAELVPSVLVTASPDRDTELAVYADLDILGQFQRAEGTIECIELPPGMTCEAYNPFFMPGYGFFTLRPAEGITPLGINTYKVRVTAFGESLDLTGKVAVVGRERFTVTSPVDQDIWPGGTKTISWQYEGDPGPTVRLELYDRGVFKQVIADDVPSGADGKGYYSWTIPDSMTFSSRHQVRIVSKSKPEMSGINDGRVWIGRGVEIYRPKGKDVLLAGETMWIGYTWASYILVDFELFKGGKYVMTMLKDAEGMYHVGANWPSTEVWGIPPDLPGGNDYQIRAVPKADPSRAFFNEGGPFTIVNASIALTSPKSGDNWRPGSTQTISWQWQGDPVPPAQDVKVTVGVENDVYTISSSAPLGAGGAGQVTWVVPENVRPGPNYTVAVTTNSMSPVKATVAPIAMGNYTKVNVTIVGSGWVRSWTHNKECTQSCDLDTLEGTQVFLDASALSGYKFQGWSGQCSGTDDCRFTVPAGGTALTATFVKLPDYSVSLSHQAVTISDSSPAQLSVSLVPVPRFDGEITLSCPNLPYGLSCSFARTTVTPGAETVAVELTVSKTKAGGNQLARTGRQLGWALLGCIGLPFGAFLLGGGTRRKSWHLLVLAFVLVGAAAMAACGGGGGGTSGGGGGGTLPSERKYQITVRGKSGYMERTAVLDVAVR